MRTFITILLITSLSGAAAAAEPASREEIVGVSSGAIIGAVAGGPVGFIVGAAIGASIGDRMHVQNDNIEELEVTLKKREQTLSTLETKLDRLHAGNSELDAEVERLRGLARPELVELMQAGIAMDLLFRTDEDVLTDTTGARLFELGRTLSAMPDVHVQLDGFADERGAEDYNLDLSNRRVDFVREQLLSAGIPAERILTRAHGESVAQDASNDSFALERRVTLKLFLAGDEAVAAR